MLAFWTQNKPQWLQHIQRNAQTVEGCTDSVHFSMRLGVVEAKELHYRSNCDGLNDTCDNALDKCDENVSLPLFNISQV